MQPLLGKNGYIEFYKGGDYRPFVCCESVEIDFSTEQKSVKTVGDGIWKRSRIQSIGYTISVSGLTPYDDDVNPTTFDLLDYLTNATDILYQMVFEKIDGSVFKVIRGTAGVNSLGISSPQDFVTGTIELVGQGMPEITEVADICLAVIQSLQTQQQTDHSQWRITVVGVTNGPVLRYDYSIDGHEELTSLAGNFFVTGITIGLHTINIYPVCSNGIKGALFTQNFTRTT